MDLTERAETRRETFYKLTNSADVPTAPSGNKNLFKGSLDFSGTNWINNNNGAYAEDYQGVKIFKTQSLWGGRSQYFEVKTGEEYVFSAYVKSSATTDSVYFFLNNESKQPKATGAVSFGSATGVNSVIFNFTNEYQRIVIKVKITSDGWMAPRLERFNSNAYLFFGGYKIEKSNVATSYSQAPEDLGWSTTTLAPTQTQRYLWKFDYVYYSDGSVETTQPVNISIAGADGNTSYIHFAYASSSDGKTGFSFTDTKQQYQGYYTDFIQTSSTDPTKYTWMDRTANVQVGGVNLLTNRPTNWQNKYVVTSGTGTGSFLQQSSTTRISPKNFIAVKSGKKYTISLRELTGVDYYFKVTMSTVNAYGVANSMLNADEWIRTETYTFTAPENCKYIMISVGCDSGVTPNDLNNKFNIKLEEGNIPTSYSKADEDTQADIDNKADELITQDQLNALKEQSELHQKELDAKADLNTSEKWYQEYLDSVNINNENREKSEAALLAISERVASIVNDLGETKERWNFIDTYMDVAEEGLVIGKQDGSANIKISNDRISMFSNGDEVMWISQNMLHIANGVFVQTLQIGNFRFESLDTNGEILGLRYLGG